MNKEVLAAAKTNTNFRQVIFTGEHTQLVLMSLHPSEDIGSEVHPHNDQILFIVEGQGHATVEGKTYDVTAGDFVAVPAGSRHNIENGDGKDMKIVTIYGPPDHKPGTIHPTKADALKDEGPAEQMAS